MRNKNWTNIGIAVLIAGLLYYFFMQNESCMKCGKGSKSEVATSMDVEAEEFEGDDGYGEDVWMQEEAELDQSLGEEPVR